MNPCRQCGELAKHLQTCDYQDGGIDGERSEVLDEERNEQQVNSAGLATCRCGSVNVILLPVLAEGEVAYWQAECPRCDRRGARAPQQTAISLWNADVAVASK